METEERKVSPSPCLDLRVKAPLPGVRAERAKQHETSLPLFHALVLFTLNIVGKLPAKRKADSNNCGPFN